MTGNQRLRINNKEITPRWVSMRMHYEGDVVNFSCRQTSNAPSAAVTFKAGAK